MATVELTADGDLRIEAALAKKHFPFGSLVVVKKETELWLMPTRGADFGGLVLKQSTADGERSVLIREHLDAPIVPGPRNASWDAWRGALRVQLGAPT